MTQKAKRIIAKLQNQKQRDRILNELHKTTVDDAAPVGGTDGQTILKDLNEFDRQHDQFMESLRNHPVG